MAKAKVLITDLTEFLNQFVFTINAIDTSCEYYGSDFRIQLETWKALLKKSKKNLSEEDFNKLLHLDYIIDNKRIHRLRLIESADDINYLREEREVQNKPKKKTKTVSK